MAFREAKRVCIGHDIIETFEKLCRVGVSPALYLIGTGPAQTGKMSVLQRVFLYLLVFFRALVITNRVLKVQKL